MRWLIPRMSAFQRRHTEVEIRLTTSVAPVNFLDNSYDLAIRAAVAAPGGCRSTPFMDERIVAVCHADLLETKPLTRPEDLQSHTLISYATEPYSWSDWLQAAQCPGLRAAGSLRFEQMFFALQAAVEGLGIVLVPLFLVIDDVVAGRLCVPFGPLATRRRTYFASFSSGATPFPVADNFCEWLIREGRDTQGIIAEWAREMDWSF
jgi:LysR family glycine cleavage system transcriptional activator